MKCSACACLVVWSTSTLLIFEQRIVKSSALLVKQKSLQQQFAHRHRTRIWNPQTGLQSSQTGDDEWRGFNKHANDDNNKRPSLQEMAKEASNLVDKNNLLGSWNRTTVDKAVSFLENTSRIRHRQASMAMERVLHRMVQEQTAGNPIIKHVHMTPLYEALVGCWVRSGSVQGLERAEDILEYIVSVVPRVSAPRRESFNSLLMAHARSGRPNAPEGAVRFMSKWFDWYEAGRCSFTPNTISYAAVLHAYAQYNPSLQLNYQPALTQSHKTQTFDSPALILRLLDSMERLSSRYPSVKPDVLCYREYFVALSVAARRNQISPTDCALLSEKHLHRMRMHSDPKVHPDSWSFNRVVLAWRFCNSTDSVERCERVLRLQEEHHAAKNYSSATFPVINSYNLLIQSYARAQLKDKIARSIKVLRRLEADEHLPNPNSFTYCCVMNVCAKSGDVDAAAIAKRLLVEMETKEKRGDPLVRLSIRPINVYLDACAKSGLPRSAETIRAWLTRLREMAQNGDRLLAPNRISYNAYLQALSKTKDASGEVEAVLEEMHSLHEQGYHEVKPDLTTFTTVLHCLSRSGRDDALNSSLALLDHLEELHAQGQENMRPSYFTYNCCVNAAAKSPHPGKAKVALRILRRMQSVGARAGTATYNSVINACAFSLHPKDSPEESLELAFEMFDEARQKVGANHITYVTMIRVVSSHVRDDKQKWKLVRGLVELCAKDGQLTPAVMRGVRLTTSRLLHRELLKKVTDKRTGDYKDEFVANVRKTEMQQLRPREH